jgi:DNA primase
MSDLVIGVLEDFLGEAKHHYESKSQLSFACPACADEKGRIGDDGKAKLAVNYKQGVFKCWVCGNHNNMQGTIPFLIKRYGSKSNLDDYFLLKPDDYDGDVDDIVLTEPDVEMPEGYTPLTEEYNKVYKFKDALDYLLKRGVTHQMIKDYKIGFTTKGEYSYRIILPSFNINNKLNYFVGRSFYENSAYKYLNPDADKMAMIFNEHMVNWDSTIYLVEGAFDHIVVPNSIPVLGKVLSDKLIDNILYKANGFVVILMDPDASNDAKRAYLQLNTGRLKGRVKIIFIQGRTDIKTGKFVYDDVSETNQNEGPKGVLKLLKLARRLSDRELYQLSLDKRFEI